MSNYLKITKHPDTGNWETARWIDNHFGSHKYGVIFEDGKVFDPSKTKLETNDAPPDKDWDWNTPQSQTEIFEILGQFEVDILDLVGEEFAPKKKGGSAERKRLLGLADKTYALKQRTTKQLERYIEQEKALIAHNHKADEQIIKSAPEKPLDRTKMRITIDSHGELYTSEIAWDSSTPKVVLTMMNLLVASSHSRETIEDLFQDNDEGAPFTWNIW